MSDEVLQVNVHDWEKMQRKHGKVLRQLRTVSTLLSRLEAQVERDNNEFAVAFLMERRKRVRAEEELAAVRIVADEHKQLLRKQRKRDVRRKVDFTE